MLVESWMRNLLLLVGRENVYDAVNRRRGRARVQGGEDEVTCLRQCDGGGDRFQVPHLADEDHIGVFAQGGAQGIGERIRVCTEFPLVYHAFLVGVQVLDGVLDSQDVRLTLRVDNVDQRCDSGGFAGTRRAGDQDPGRRASA